MKKSKVLIIEDEEDISELLTIRLTRLGCYVAVAGDGEIGLQKIKETHPDLVILDLMLPRLSGEEVCKAIRENEDPSLSQTPIIMLTAKVTEADKIIGKVIGANSYMTKPFDPEELMMEIEKYLHLKYPTEVI